MQGSCKGHAYLMATIPDLLDAVDAFVHADKRIAGADGPCIWAPGYNKYEKKTKFPIEVGGELIDAARLEIIAMPDRFTSDRTGIQFRISLCYNAAICRLDVTDEIHPNTRRIPEDNVPPDVEGPHFHSWKLNRRFFKGISTAPELHTAELFTSKGSFDSNLRWFCQQVNIQQPDGRHVIELPTRTNFI